MMIFIDSASIDEITEAVGLGFVDGCTTNPSLLAKAHGDVAQVIPEICALVDGPVSAEVVSERYDEIVAEGRTLAKLHPHVVVKVPLIVDGLRAVRTFAREGIKTNVTLCFSATQALLAAKAGATYVPKHPLTESGLAKFLAEHRAAQLR